MRRWPTHPFAATFHRQACFAGHPAPVQSSAGNGDGAFITVDAATFH